MIINRCQQSSLEWLLLRLGIPTASDFDNLITPKWEVRTGEMPKTYVAQKIAEAWLQSPLAGFMSIDMEIGQILEQKAIPAYEFMTGHTVDRVGFITTDDGKIGCSPDGLIGTDCGIEVKCPRHQTHVAYLLSGVLPKEYAAQVHGSMFVTGLPRWIFTSWCRNFPTFILEIERDEEIQEAIGEALAAFRERFDEAWERMVKINGGPPPKRVTPQFEPKPERVPSETPT